MGSSSVIEMLKTLKLKFEDEQIAANKAETNAINAYDLALNSREEVKARKEDSKKEMEAMKVAIKILAKVTGVRTEAPGNPVPPPSPVKGDALMQLASTDPKMRAVQLLRTAAEASHSQAMARLAQEVATHLKDGPFDQINNMIQKMIFRLMAEQKDEDDHKNWCDKELSE